MEHNFKFLLQIKCKEDKLQEILDSFQDAGMEYRIIERIQSSEYIPISSLSISRRLWTILMNEDIKFLNQISQFKRKEIMGWRNLGKTTLNELERLMEEYNIKYSDGKGQNFKFI